MEGVKLNLIVEMPDTDKEESEARGYMTNKSAHGFGFFLWRLKKMAGQGRG